MKYLVPLIFFIVCGGWWRNKSTIFQPLPHAFPYLLKGHFALTKPVVEWLQLSYGPYLAPVVPNGPAAPVHHSWPRPTLQVPPCPPPAMPLNELMTHRHPPFNNDAHLKVHLRKKYHHFLFIESDTIL